MPWQKVTKHINDIRVEVESKRGKRYPVETRYDFDNTGIYRMLHNIADTGDDRQMWAWVDFGDDGPILEDYSIKRKGDGPPAKTPMEH